MRCSFLFFMLAAFLLAPAEAASRSFPAGEHPLNDPVILGDGESLTGAGIYQTIIRPSRFLEAVVRNANEGNGNSQISISDLTVDCRNNADFGMRLIRVSELQIRNARFIECRMDGLRVSGQGQRTRGFVIDNVRAEENGQDGVIVLWAMRDGIYSNVFTKNNGRNGITIDHSEFTATNIVSRENVWHGIWLRNLFGGTLNNLTATHNRRHGIYAQGVVASTGTAWRAQANSRSGAAQFDDIHFTNDASLSYGVTRNVSINGVTVGNDVTFGTDRFVRHGINIEDGIRNLRITGAIYGDTLEQPLCRACRAGLATQGAEPAARVFGPWGANGAPLFRGLPEEVSEEETQRVWTPFGERGDSDNEGP